MESGHLNLLTGKTVAFRLTVSEDIIAEQLQAETGKTVPPGQQNPLKSNPGGVSGEIHRPSSRRTA